MRGDLAFVATIMLIIGLVRMDDTSPEHLRLGYIALGFAALLYVLAVLTKDDD